MVIFDPFEVILTKFLPFLLYGIGFLTSFLIIGVTIYRRREIKDWINFKFLGKGIFDHREIFREYVEKLGCQVSIGSCDAALQFLVSTLNVDGASILVKSSDSKFRIKAAHSSKIIFFVADQNDSFLEFLAKHKSPVTRQSLYGDKRSSRVKSQGLRYFIQLGADVAIPLFAGSQLYGVVNLGPIKRGNYETKRMRELLSFIGSIFSVMIHNSNLHGVLLKQNRRIQELKSYRHKLLSNLSHEIRTPLNGIIGVSEMMAEGGYGQMTKEQVEPLSMIRQSGDDLLNTVETMFDISRIENNQLELDVKKINVSRLFKSVAEYIGPNQSGHVSFKIDPFVSGVYGDEGRLAQVFKNLLCGVSKSSACKSHVVETSKKGEMLMVTIRSIDAGAVKTRRMLNLDQEDLNSEIENIMGLNFTLSKKIVELHGGRVWVSKGRSKSVCVSLPTRPVV